MNILHSNIKTTCAVYLFSFISSFHPLLKVLTTQTSSAHPLQTHPSLTVSYQLLALLPAWVQDLPTAGCFCVIQMSTLICYLLSGPSGPLSNHGPQHRSVVFFFHNIHPQHHSVVFSSVILNHSEQDRQSACFLNDIILIQILF